jgi:hypothetical protein
VTFIVFGAVILGPLLDELTWQIVLALDLQVSRWTRLFRYMMRHDSRLLGEHRRVPDAWDGSRIWLPTGWARQDSNLDLTDYESAALTIELRALPRI